MENNEFEESLDSAVKIVAPALAVAAFENQLWFSKPNALRSVLMQLRFGVAWRPEFDGNPIEAALAVAKFYREYLVATRKLAPGASTTDMISKLIKAIAETAFANDPHWAHGIGLLSQNAPSPKPTEHRTVPRNRRSMVTITDLEVRENRHRTETYTRTYSGSIDLDKDEVLSFLRDDDLDGLAEMIESAINDSYYEWSDSDDDFEADYDSDESDETTGFPNCRGEAEALREQFEEELAEEEEEEEE